MASFDLLDRPLVYIPVTFDTIGEDADGMAIVVPHTIEVQIEMLDDEEVKDWARASNVDPFMEERLALVARANAASELLDAGDANAAKMLADISDEQDALTLRGETAARERDLASFKRVARGWRKIKAGNRTPEFNDANIRALLRWPGFGTAFGQAFMATWNRKVEIRTGNSAGSPANGPAVEPSDATTKDATSSPTT